MMKKLPFLFLLSILLFVGCQKEFDKDPEIKLERAFKERLRLINRPVDVVPGNGFKTYPAADLGFQFTLIAEVDAPELNGQTLQATHVAIEGNLAYVSYNMIGPQSKGALDVINISDPASPLIVKTLLFDKKDINTVGLFNGMIVLAGQDSNGAFYGFIDPDDPQDLLQVHRLNSYSAIGHTVKDDLLYVISGINGGLTVVDASGNEEYFPFYDARSVAVSEEVYVLTREKIYALNNDEITLDPGYVQAESKAELDVSDHLLFAALNRGGAHIYNAADLTLMQVIPRPTKPDGSNSENYVTNSVAFNDPLLLLGNGGAGITVHKKVWSESTGQESFIPFGFFDFGGSLSANFVKSKGDYIFVATGLGGLKILTILQDEVEEDCNWTNETAFAGSNAGNGPAWWFYFDNTTENIQHPIYAGRKLVDGAFAHYVDGVMTIELGPKMVLHNVSESVKIQGYNQGQLPQFRPPAGLFTTYKGNELVVEIDYYPYYVIHLDVKVCK
jgi:hypothetical protein